MRVVGNLLVVKEINVDMPFGATIQNETDTQEGTPVVREIIGDVLTNMYRLLELAEIVPTDTEDSDATQYQLVDALKNLPNSLNDIERVLLLDGNVWGVDLKFSILPNKYVFFARASDNYIAGTEYGLQGSDSAEISFTSPGFKSGDELIVVLDNSGARAYSISKSSEGNTEIFTVMGTPVSYNDSNKIWYQDSGRLISDAPSVNNLQNIIGTEISDLSVKVFDMLIINGYVLCFCYLENTKKYFFRQFSLSNLTVSTPVVISGSTFQNTDDFQPYVYAEAGFVYVTNQMNIDAGDNKLTKLTYTPNTSTMTFVSTINLAETFVKTTNAVVKNNLLYTMIAGNLFTFNLSSGVRTLLGVYPSVLGQLFGFNGEIYFGSGEVSKRWF